MSKRHPSVATSENIAAQHPGNSSQPRPALFQKYLLAAAIALEILWIVALIVLVATK
jgi:hypothetical protein